MKCLIVDDEPLARDVLSLYLQKTAHVHMVGMCANSVEAFVALHNEDVDLVLLDIKMPEISGLDFIKSLKNPPLIIITTAYPEYALEGYDLDIVDYLMKPIRYERFVKAIDKAKMLSTKTLPSKNQKESAVLYVKSDRKLVRIKIEEIIYIEGLKNYLIIHNLSSRKVIVHSSFVGMEHQLSAYANLQRVHKSFLINTNHIQEVENHMAKMIDEASIPIGNSFRKYFYNLLKLS